MILITKIYKMYQQDKTPKKTQIQQQGIRKQYKRLKM